MQEGEERCRADWMAGRSLFVMTIALGSFLLFLVQPMIAKIALPRFGGSPSVWNSAMLVYQTLLLAGYAYAHAIARLRFLWQIMVHTAAFAIAASWLPIGLGAETAPSGLDPILWAPLLIATSIGPLFLVVASQAPLVQRWHAIGGGDPYPLYSASNLGSLSGLLAYPLLIEPFMDINGQRMVWSVGFVLLAAITGMVAATVRRNVPEARMETTPSPKLGDHLRWILMAAVPSGLMLSTTTYLTTDIVATPLLWVLPLATYLSTFVLSFSGKDLIVRWTMRATPLLLLVAAMMTLSPNGRIPLVSVPIGLATLFAVGTSLHGMMNRTKPAADHLTGFYLSMSLGGVIGGFCCAILAPILFDWVWEHPLLLIAATLLVSHRPLILEEGLGNRVATAITMLMAILILGGVVYGGRVAIPGLVITTLMGFIVICAVGSRVAAASCMLAFMMFQATVTNLAGAATDTRFRSYFGSYRIVERGDVRVLYSGTTIHGMQKVRPHASLERLSYYGESAGVTRAYEAVIAGYGPRPRVGVVGLGAGTLACLSRPRQEWEFYEIDPDVVRVANDSRRFTYMRDCAPEGAAITLGDARLAIERERALSKDVLILDAFSSDAIPTHLMTREAFSQYSRVIGPHGTLIIHISNQHVDLEPLLAGMPEWHPSVLRDLPKRRDRGESTWAALSLDPQIADSIRAHDARWHAPRARKGLKPWTDGHASILPLLKF